MSERSTAGGSFWNATGATTEPLTLESFMDGMAALKRRADWEYQHPHGVSPENPHIVSSKTKERLARDGKGWAFCGTCGPFYYEPVKSSDRSIN